MTNTWYNYLKLFEFGKFKLFSLKQNSLYVDIIHIWMLNNTDKKIQPAKSEPTVPAPLLYTTRAICRSCAIEPLILFDSYFSAYRQECMYFMIFDKRKIIFDCQP